MSGNLKDIQALIPLLDMAFEVKRVKLSQIARRIADLQDQLDDIDRAAAEVSDPMSPAYRVGADLRWQAWAEQRKRLISRELTKAMSKRAEHATVVARALAKRDAAEKLADHAKQELRLSQSRRSEY